MQDGDAVIPVRRRPIQSEHPNWEYVLEPGLAWTSRGRWLHARGDTFCAAGAQRKLPAQRRSELRVARGAGAVSDVFFEIAGETCAYFKFETWGLRKARLYAGRRRK